MAAHIYGKPLAATEAFTHMRAHWSAYPAALKPGADAAFCDGINFLIWHTFTASPPEFGKPGVEYFAGTHLNPNVTWFEQSGPFLQYLARCQWMLRQGQYVADLCCYTGDKPYLHWGRGEQWCEKPSLTPGKGHAYDLINTEVLLERLAVKNNRLLLPEGLSYRMLVVDLEEETIPLEALRKIVELAKAGATVVLGQRQPIGAPGLRDYPAGDEEIRRLANELWGQSGQPSRRVLGKGKIVSRTSLAEALTADGILPDFAGPWDYTHRRAGDWDIYFVVGQGAAECVFRVTGKAPELWDPVTGQIRDAVHYRETADGRTLVPISLPENGAVFIVFRQLAQAASVVSATVPPSGLEILGRRAGTIRARCWQNGQYQLVTAESDTLRLDIKGLPDPVTLTGPWEVQFAPGLGAPATVVFDQLTAWNQHQNEGIKYFSGTAKYRQTFKLTAAQAKKLVRLDLGQVRHIARVRLNGTLLGIVWTSPWSMDLSGKVKTGRNELEIEVTNLWVNRLIGDAGRPPEKRFTKTNVRLEREGRLEAYQGYTANHPLETSGLLGPVILQFGEEHEFRPK
jgi:hypothetical protein